ncbi:MAG: hypothetical protein ACP5RN_14055 [Armatimonadota bacterium]
MYRIRAPLGKEKRQFDDTPYNRRDLQWAQRCFVCGFIFIYDRVLWNPNRMRYRVDELIEQVDREFGGFDEELLLS